MAARNAQPNARQQEQVRTAIRTTQLVKRLQHFALAEKDEQDVMVEIDAVRLKAIEVLLRKSLPDLQSIEHKGDPDNPLVHRIEQTIVDPKG